MNKLNAAERAGKRVKEPAIPPTPAMKGKGPATPHERASLDMLLAGISLGKSARKMCAEVGISRGVFWRWLAEDEELMRQYQRAKEFCVDAYAEEIIEISDDGSKDIYIDEKGREVVNREVLARAQLRIDARKWYAARLAPRKYGDKPTVTCEGGDAGNPAVQRIEVAFVAPAVAPRERNP